MDINGTKEIREYPRMVTRAAVGVEDLKKLPKAAAKRRLVAVFLHTTAPDVKPK